MKLVFYASDKPREQDLGQAVLAGAKRHNWDVELRQLCADPVIEPGTTAVAMVGVKSTRLFEITRKAGAVPVMFDKGYVRSRRAGARVWDYWRVSVGRHHPTQTSLMSRKMPRDRLDQLALAISPWRTRGYTVVIAGSSAKYHEFYGLPEPELYYPALVEQLRELTKKPIIYRPKPSYREATRIKGAEFSAGGTESITSTLQGAWALVTHGSNACFEAALMGVPSIILGDGVAAPISSTRLEDVADPRIGKREQWLANLAYHQYTEAELRTGEAFQHVGRWIGEQSEQSAR